MRLSLRAKIVGPFVLIVALIGTIGTAAVTALVTSESVAEFNGSLLRASLLANDHLSLVEAARLTTLRAAAVPSRGSRVWARRAMRISGIARRESR